MITRRHLIGASLLTAAAGLSGCGQGSGSGGGSEGGGEIRFSWWGNPSRQALTQQAIDAFTAQNPDIKVSGEQTSWAGYWDKLATEVAARNAADAMQQVDPYIIEYGQRGALADLTQFSVIDTSAFPENVLASSRIDGELYGVPGGLNAPSMWVNLKVFEELGMDLPDDESWSWEDYAALSAEISGKSGGDVTGSDQLSLNEQCFAVYVRQHGKQLFTPDGQVGFEPQLLTDWWSYIMELMRSGASLDAQTSVENQGLALEQTALITGKTALNFNWSSSIGPALDIAGTDIALIKPPGETTGVARGCYVKPSLHYSVSAQSENGEAAAALINFIVNSPEAGKILGTDRGTPANPEVLAAIKPDFDAGDTAAADYIAELSTLEWEPLPIFPTGASSLTEMFPRYTQTVLFEQQQPAEAAEQLVAELSAALS